VFSAENLVLGYGTHSYVLKEVSFAIPKNQATVIIGPNGSGKSTLLNALARIIAPWEGEIYFNNQPLKRLPVKEFARKVALLPQSPSVPDDFSIYDLVTQGRFPYRNWMGFMEEHDLDVIEQAIRWVGLERLSYRMVSTLSGGERQRAYLAMAMAQEPEVLLLDEPTTFLDISYQFEVMELIQRLNQEKGITIVMVLHNINQALQYADEVMVLHQRGIYAQGPPNVVITPQSCEDVFRVQASFVDVPGGQKLFVPVGVVSARRSAGPDGQSQAGRTINTG
jgi:iron complex transport system ATP-binding protein